MRFYGLAALLVVSAGLAVPAQAESRCPVLANGEKLPADYRIKEHAQLAGGGDYSLYTNGECNCSITWSHGEIVPEQDTDADSVQQKLKPTAVGTWSCKATEQ